MDTESKMFGLFFFRHLDIEPEISRLSFFLGDMDTHLEIIKIFKTPSVCRPPDQGTTRSGFQAKNNFDCYD